MLPPEKGLRPEERETTCRRTPADLDVSHLLRNFTPEALAQLHQLCHQRLQPEACPTEQVLQLGAFLKVLLPSKVRSALAAGAPARELPEGGLPGGGPPQRPGGASYYSPRELMMDLWGDLEDNADIQFLTKALVQPPLLPARTSL
ncbi:Zinc finger and SCAN domain-containing protein 18 [Myotis davidii]|uniref:Zinc finger and SCAN domain-containing protein 18 n=1 Tax=Myotis davidii TaxID=225400 RepID=L5M5C9_MYODS|nr:Zinc finger and SCAN domain-containing protein 18 [Myotis davidii]